MLLQFFEQKYHERLTLLHCLYASKTYPCHLYGAEPIPLCTLCIRDMTHIPLIKAVQVTDQPSSVSGWFRSAHGGLIRANVVGFIQTVEKGKLTSHFGSFTVSLELPGDPSPPRRATHEDEVNTVENRAKTWSPHETTGTFFLQCCLKLDIFSVQTSAQSLHELINSLFAEVSLNCVSVFCRKKIFFSRLMRPGP